MLFGSDCVVVEFEAALNDRSFHWNVLGISRKMGVRIDARVAVKRLIAALGPELAAAERFGASGRRLWRPASCSIHRAIFP